MSSGLGGLNKSRNGVVIGVVQLQLPTVVTADDLAAQTTVIVDMVRKARRNLSTMDLVVFPEYSLHGLSMDINPAIMCSIDGPEVQAFQGACIECKIWGCFSIMEYNPNGNPYNSGIIINDKGVIVLYYRKLHPWVPGERIIGFDFACQSHHQEYLQSSTQPSRGSREIWAYPSATVPLEVSWP
jgi:formamidase